MSFSVTWGRTCTRFFITDEHHNSLDEKDVLDWVSEAAFLRVDVDQGDHFFGGVCDLGMKAVLKRSARYEPDQVNGSGRLYDGYWALPDRHGSESFEDASAVVSEILELFTWQNLGRRLWNGWTSP